MISEDECMKLILEKFPDFIGVWQEHLAWWDDEIPGFSNNMSVFSRYVVCLLQGENRLSEIKDIFLFIESLLVSGTDIVKNAATTCFLENLLNALSDDRITASSFVPLLGSESKRYCKAWDQFTEIRSPLLWDDSEWEKAPKGVDSLAK